MNDETVPMTIRFPRDLHEQLRKAAFEQRRPITRIVIDAARESMSAWADVKGEGNK